MSRGNTAAGEDKKKNLNVLFQRQKKNGLMQPIFHLAAKRSEAAGLYVWKVFPDHDNISQSGITDENLSFLGLKIFSVGGCQFRDQTVD